MGSSSTALLGIPEVQKELSVTDEQKKKIEEVTTEAREAMRGAFGGGGGGGGGDFRKVIEETNKKSDEKLAKILEAKQTERLAQLKLQREGVAAFLRPEIAKQLSLSEEQQKKVKEVQDAAQQAGGGRGPGRDASDDDRKAFQKKQQEARDKTKADTLAVLNEEQKKKWSEIQGKEFKFPEGAGFGGFGGGRGGKGADEAKKRPDSKKDI